MNSLPKQILFLILFIGLLPCIRCLGQDATEQQVKAIKIESDQINKDIKKYKITQTDVNDLSAEGGILKKYYEGSVFRKAELTVFGETGQSTTEYFFLNGNLIFVRERTETYKVPLGMGKVEVENTEINKFYFKETKLIQWMDNSNEIISPTLYSEKEKEILDDVKNIINKDE